MAEVTVYGITNCDQVKKAKTWLTTHEISYQLHDFHREGVCAELITSWLKHIDLPQLLNKKSTTWRGLSEQEKLLSESADLIALMIKYPTLIKRPVLCIKDTILVGYQPDRYGEIMDTQTT